MSNDSSYDYFCSARPQDIKKPQDEEFSCSMFSINVTAISIRWRFDLTDGDEFPDDGEEYDMINDTWEFMVPRDQLMILEGDTSRSGSIIIHDMFFERNERPVPEVVVDKILDCAQSMATDSYYTARKVMRMEVSLTSIPIVEEVSSDLEALDDDEAAFMEVEEDGSDFEGMYDEEVEEDWSDFEGMYDEEEGDIQCKLVTASQPWAKTLELVKIDASIRKQCAICLEELPIGSDASRTPCLHIYHSACIGNWMKMNSTCPLCRFEMGH